MKKLDSTDDMMKLGRWMALTKHDDTKARQKSLTLVKVFTYFYTVQLVT